MFQPSGSRYGRNEVTKQRTDLFTTLLKAAADNRLGGAIKRERLRPSDEVEQIRFNVGTRVKTGSRDFVPGCDGVSGLKKNRNGPKRFGSGLGGVTLRGLLLEHQHQRRGQWTGQYAVEPRGRDGVGKIGHDFKVAGR